MTKKNSKMTAHRGIEIALEDAPPSAWRTAPAVTQALISCPRAHRMAANALRRFGVSKEYVEEVVQDSALVMQTKILVNGIGDQRGQLREIADVYFVLYRVIDLTVRNYQKKPSYAATSIVSNFSEVQFDDESHEDMMGRVTHNEIDEGGFERVDQRLDAQSSRSRLRAKLEKLGWPEHIHKERTVRGRPSKY